MKGHRAARNAFLAVGASLAAFASAPDSPTDDDVALIRLVPDPSRVSLTAHMRGTLAIRNGCVHLVSTGSGVESLVLWPPTYRLWRPDGRVSGIADTATGRTLALGVEAKFGGGRAKGVSESELETPIPPACEGPAVYAEFSSAMRVTQIAGAVFRSAARDRSREAEACRSWRLTSAEAEEFFALSEEISQQEAMSHFYWLPCSISGKIEKDGVEWEFTINGAATAVLKRNDEGRYFGCGAAACEKLVMLPTDYMNPDP